MTGYQLKQIIRNLGYTQEQAAIKLGVARGTLNNWCKQSELSPAQVKQVNDAFQVFVENTTESSVSLSASDLWELVKSQQRIIENLTKK